MTTDCDRKSKRGAQANSEVSCRRYEFRDLEIPASGKDEGDEWHVHQVEFRPAQHAETDTPRTNISHLNGPIRSPTQGLVAWDGEIKREVFPQRPRFQAAGRAARALAHLHFVPEHLRHNLLSVRGFLSGYNQHIVHWKIRERMREADVEIALQRAT